MSGDYPNGCTQAMHDAAYQSYTDAESNAIQAEVEWRAEQEVAQCSPEFAEWLMDRRDVSDLARMIAFYKAGKTTDCRTIVDNIVSDYTQYRVANLSADEENDIAESI